MKKNRIKRALHSLIDRMDYKLQRKVYILGKIGTVKEIRKLPNTDDMYAYFIHFRYVNLKAAPGNKKPYYAMLDDMIEPINLEVVGEKKK